MLPDCFILSRLSFYIDEKNLKIAAIQNIFLELENKEKKHYSFEHIFKDLHMDNEIILLSCHCSGLPIVLEKCKC